MKIICTTLNIVISMIQHVIAGVITPVVLAHAILGELGELILHVGLLVAVIIAVVEVNIPAVCIILIVGMLWCKTSRYIENGWHPYRVAYAW